jgi:hypothetical protein
MISQYEDKVEVTKLKKTELKRDKVEGLADTDAGLDMEHSETKKTLNTSS